MKTFLTIELLGLVLLIISQWIDLSARESEGYSDGGWVWHYNISRKIRNQTTHMAFVSFLIMVGGVIFIIWN